MKINQVLVESAGATVAFAFGRFNPAHQGHIEVWRAVEEAGANWFIGTNPSTLGPNDPLTFQQKSAWMEEIYPPIAGHIVPEQSVLTLAAYIFKKLRKNERATVAYITDDTDWAWSGKLLNQYNGVEGAHGYYKFAQIVHEPSPRVSSATDLRNAARADDRVAFYHASGTDPKSKVAGLSYFDTVKQAVEKYPVPVKRGQKVKEQGVAEGLQQTLRKVVPGYAKREIDKKMDAGKFGKTDADKDANFQRYKKIQDKLKEQGVAEGAPIVVAQAPIDVRNPKKAAQPYRNQGDIVPDTKPPSTEKRGVKGRPGQRPMPTYDVAEVSTELRNRYVTRASDDYSNANFAARASKDHSGLDDYSREQEQRAKKRAAGLNRALSDKRTGREQNVAEEQKTVAKTWDQMTPQEKSSGVKGRTVWNERTQRYYTVFDVPAKEVDEASLATMRDYFAGDENARDPFEITKQRLHFAKDKDVTPTTKKEFRSQWEYEQWLKQNKLKPISNASKWTLINKNK